MQFLRNFFLFFLVFVPIQCSAETSKADLLIFSFDRPLQLYALLESIEKYVSGLGEIAILYRTSNDEYNKAYALIKDFFPYINYIKQSQTNPYGDFREKTFRILNEFKNSYLLFAVDDIIVKDYVNLSICADLLEKNKAYGFYLRLGKNINYCYMVNKYQSVPPLQEVEEGIFLWNFSRGELDWGYPKSVDMCLYRKQQVLPLIEHLPFYNPNTFEGNWAGTGQAGLTGLCFAESKIINIPLNSVNIYQNKHMNFASTKELLTLFNEGLKIDIHSLFKINNNSPHIDGKPSFATR